MKKWKNKNKTTSDLQLQGFNPLSPPQNQTPKKNQQQQQQQQQD
jgi:hypothetical protein